VKREKEKAMQTYLYCSDESARRGTPVSHLTPRCWFLASSRAEARAILQRIEDLRHAGGRQFGVAGVRQESARERNRLAGAPSEVLPECEDWLRDLGFEPRDPARGVGIL
jgi:hypothetical protein